MHKMTFSTSTVSQSFNSQHVTWAQNSSNTPHHIKQETESQEETALKPKKVAREDKLTVSVRIKKPSSGRNQWQSPCLKLDHSSERSILSPSPFQALNYCSYDLIYFHH